MGKMNFFRNFAGGAGKAETPLPPEQSGGAEKTATRNPLSGKNTFIIGGTGGIIPFCTSDETCGF
jgi:hypothetical protein